MRIETEDTVRADADPDCAICKGAGWHWGWDRLTHEPLKLRCPCVSRRRANHPLPHDEAPR